MRISNYKLRRGMCSLYLIVLLATLISCGDSPVAPTPPPPPVEEPQPPPRVEADFSWDYYQGYIFFGAGAPGCQEPEDVANNALEMLQVGWNSPQICAETEFWDSGCGGPYPRKPRDLERLRAILDKLARIPGVQPVVVGNCTIKRQVPLSEQAEWARQVAQVVAEFRNVAVFTHNEFDNCRGRSDWGGNAAYCAGKQDVAEHIRIYKAAGVRYVTADDSFRPPKPSDPPSLTYGFRLKNIGAWPASFHPDRTKDGHPWDPSLHQLRQLAEYNGLFVLSETVAFADFSGQCGGLRTCDIGRIEAYIDRCAQVPECRFTLHGENLLMGEVPSVLPSAAR